MKTWGLTHSYVDMTDDVDEAHPGDHGARGAGGRSARGGPRAGSAGSRGGWGGKSAKSATPGAMSRADTSKIAKSAVANAQFYNNLVKGVKTQANPRMRGGTVDFGKLAGKPDKSMAKALAPPSASKVSQAKPVKADVKSLLKTWESGKTLGGAAPKAPMSSKPKSVTKQSGNPFQKLKEGIRKVGESAQQTMSAQAQALKRAKDMSMMGAQAALPQQKRGHGVAGITHRR